MLDEVKHKTGKVKPRLLMGHPSAFMLDALRFEMVKQRDRLRRWKVFRALKQV